MSSRNIEEMVRHFASQHGFEVYAFERFDRSTVALADRCRGLCIGDVSMLDFYNPLIFTKHVMGILLTYAQQIDLFEGKLRVCL